MCKRVEGSNLIPGPSPKGEGDSVCFVDLIPSPSPKRRRGQCVHRARSILLKEKGTGLTQWRVSCGKRRLIGGPIDGASLFLSFYLVILAFLEMKLPSRRRV